MSSSGGEQFPLIISEQDLFSDVQRRDIEAVLFSKILVYAREESVSLDDEGFGVVARIVTGAFVDGAQRLGGIPDKGLKGFAARAVNEGLEQRRTLIQQGRLVLCELRKTSVWSGDVVSVLSDDLAIDRSLVREASDILYDHWRAGDLSAVTEIVRLFQQRTQTVRLLAEIVLANQMGLLPTDREFERYQSLVSTPQRQAMALRGFIAAAMLKMGDSEAEYTPLYITNKALDDLVGISEDLFNDPGVGREVLLSRILQTFSSTIHELYGASRELMNVHSDVGEVIDGYLNQILRNTSNWVRAATFKSFDKGSPQYWRKLRSFFYGLPLESMLHGTRFCFEPENVEQALKAGSLHLWTHGVTFGEIVVPSAQDLAAAEYVLTSGRAREGRGFDGGISGMLKDIRRANAAWTRFSGIRRSHPQRIADLKSKLEDVEQALEPIGDRDPKAKGEYRFFRGLYSRYQRAIEFHEYLRDRLDHYPETSEDVVALTHLYVVARSYFLEKNISRVTARKDRYIQALERISILDFGLWMSEESVSWDRDESDLREVLEENRRVLEQVRGYPDQSCELMDYFGAHRSCLSGFLSHLSSQTKSRRVKSELTKMADIVASQPSIDLVFLAPVLEEKLVVRVRVIEKLIGFWEKLALLEDEWKVYREYQDSGKHREPGRLVEIRRDRLLEQYFKVLPFGISDNLHSYLNELSEAERLCTLYDQFGRRTFEIPRKEELEEFFGQQKASCESVRGGRDQIGVDFWKALEKAVTNPVIPIKEAGGMWFGSFVGTLRQRLATAEALLNLEKVESELARARERVDRDTAYSEQLKLRERCEEITRRVEVLRKELDDSQDDLIAAMDKCGFVVRVEQLSG